MGVNKRVFTFVFIVRRNSFIESKYNDLNLERFSTLYLLKDTNIS